MKIRDTPKKAWSNPVLHSYAAYQSASDPRQAESRQLKKLIDLQDQGAKIYRRLPFQRVDPGELTVDDGRLGVVGLVVDTKNRDVGYVTRLCIHRNPTWHVADNLPFRSIHLQEGLRLLLEACVGCDEALPELLAFKISDSLGERSDGSSMDVACLLAIIDVVNGSSSPMLSRAAAVVSVGESGKLVKAESAGAKLGAFERELGQGSLLVRHSDDSDAAEYDEKFEVIWQVRSFAELAQHLEREGLLKDFLAEHPLSSSDRLAIKQHTDNLLADESRYGECQEFVKRLKHRLHAETPLDIRLAILRAEEDLHRHLGDFKEALQTQQARTNLAEYRYLTSYDELVADDTAKAAALYDDHDFEAAARLLEPRNKKVQHDPNLCGPLNRSYLFNTLARAWTVLEREGWEALLRQSIDLQSKFDGSRVPRTTNYLIHGLLRAGREQEAADQIEALKRCCDDRESERHLLFLEAECDRRVGCIWSTEEISQLDLDMTHHATGFLFQCLARQRGRPVDEKMDLLRQAEQTFLVNVAKENRLNVKRFLAACCRVAIAVHDGSREQINKACDDLTDYVCQPELPFFKARYADAIEACRRGAGDEEVDRLFNLVPFF